jgi:hypothetical protein
MTKQGLPRPTGEGSEPPSIGTFSVVPRTATITPCGCGLPIGASNVPRDPGHYEGAGPFVVGGNAGAEQKRFSR